MLELKINCDTITEGRIYLNAMEYLNLLIDMRDNLRNAQKHGTDADILKAVEIFYPEICRAVDHSEGAY